MNTPLPPIDKDALIASLLERIEVLMAQNAALVARVAELEAKLGLPPKTPDNSSLPPSKGQKPSRPSVLKRKAKLSGDNQGKTRIASFGNVPEAVIVFAYASDEGRLEG